MKTYVMEWWYISSPYFSSRLRWSSSHSGPFIPGKETPAST